MHARSGFMGGVAVPIRRLGQAWSAQSDEMEAEINALTTKARPTEDASILFAAANVCYAQVASFRQQAGTEFEAKAHQDASECIRKLRNRVDLARAEYDAAAHPATGTPPVTSTNPAPAWIYPAVALGVVGLLGYFIWNSR